MPIWYDNFDRADGQLGGNWAVKSGTVSIVSNAAKTANSGWAIAGPVSGPGSAMAECVVTTPAGSSGSACPVVKCDSAGTHYYFGWAQNQTTKMEFRIYYYYDGSFPFLVGYVLNGTPSTQGVLRLEYTAGVLRLYWNGAQMCQASHSVLAANPGIGIRLDQSSVEVSQFSASGDGQPRLIVSPKVVGTEDGDQLLSLLGVAVTWTPGTPGDPGFSVNGGALNSQSVTSTTNASALFSPPLLPGLVTLSDPVNGLSATITVVAGNYLGAGQGGVGGLSSLAVGWLEAQAAHGGLVLADIDRLTGAPEPDQIKKSLGDVYEYLSTLIGTSTPNPLDMSYMQANFRWLSGEYLPTMATPQPPSQTTIKEDLATLLERWSTGNPPAMWSAAEIMDNLGGQPLLNHQDLLTAIQAVGGGDLSPVLDELAAMRGDTTTSLYTLLQSLAGIRSVGAYSLADVKSWIDALPHDETVPTVLVVMGLVAALALAMPTGGASVAAAAVAVGAGPILDIATIVEVVGVLSELASIATSIAELKAAMQEPVTATPKGWPGASLVTLGDPIALADGLTIDGPMHGLLFQITRSIPGGGKYEFGPVKSWSHVGGVIFCTDNGYYERSQSIGPEHQIVNPNTMEAAESAILRLNGGFTGTVRTWKRNGPSLEEKIPS